MCAFCVQYPIQPFHQSATCTTLIKKDKNCSYLACVDFILIFFYRGPSNAFSWSETTMACLCCSMQS